MISFIGSGCSSVCNWMIEQFINASLEPLLHFLSLFLSVYPSAGTTGSFHAHWPLTPLTWSCLRFFLCFFMLLLFLFFFFLRKWAVFSISAHLESTNRAIYTNWSKTCFLLLLEHKNHCSWKQNITVVSIKHKLVFWTNFLSLSFVFDCFQKVKILVRLEDFQQAHQTGFSRISVLWCVGTNTKRSVENKNLLFRGFNF